ncbi:MAG: radical SAM protein [Myxococcota bacterium]
MDRPERPYLFYGATRALCSKCLMVCDAKEIIQDGRVYLQKRCPEHGVEKVLLSDDVEYFKLCREVYLKPPEQPFHHNTGIEYGCPYDCGICPDHEQHGCVSVLEVTDHCNLRCPTCFAQSGPHRHTHRSMAQIEAMLDCIVRNEREPDVVQVSGGEPTVHPEFFDILDACRARPIRHLMVNTNGIRIAKERDFAERLATYMPRFELYLQFDGTDDAISQELRGAKLFDLKERALQTLDELGVSTTLVATIKRGLNDDKIGEILEYAASHSCVRGVTFQPVYDEGRNEGFDAQLHRLTVSEVRRRIHEQFDAFTPEDVVPVPCHPDAIAMAYAMRGAGSDFDKLTPLTRYIPKDVLLEGGKNTIIYEGDRALMGAVTERIFQTFSTGHGPEGASKALGDLMCCLPQIDAPDIGYERVFRVIIMQFLDRHTMDLRSVRKSCVHIAHRDGKRMIPFDTYNLFYREPEQVAQLKKIRRRIGGHAERRSLTVV